MNKEQRLEQYRKNIELLCEGMRSIGVTCKEAEKALTVMCKAINKVLEDNPLLKAALEERCLPWYKKLWKRICKFL